MWAKVTGPTTAVVATARRLGWVFITPSSIRTDVGRVIDLTLDPPIAVAWEAKAAVRRWRNARIRVAFPSMAPGLPDCAEPLTTAATIYFHVDFSDVLSKVLRGKSSAKVYPSWEQGFRPSLLSAVCGDNGRASG